jgi:NAD(P)-dependent dehydrogenase (short-subunit alcohol dehydrogenase family)
MGRVDGKVAFITGAARGQGRSHALALASEGADIIAVDLCQEIDWTSYPGSSSSDLDETVRLVEGLGRRIVAAQADVRDRDALERAVSHGVEELGRLDIVVANAGIDINLTGTWHTVMASANHLIASGGGSIILVSSAGGLKAMPFMIPYTASKFGVTGLAKAFAAELADHNIRVNSLHPGGVDTVMARGESDAGELIESHPRLAGSFSTILPVTLIPPEAISNAVVFLASDDSLYITASAMIVDAGTTAL